jgi:type I restriction enzyme S subunit
VSGALVKARLTDVADLNPYLSEMPAADEAVSFLPMSAVDADRIEAVDSETRPFAEVSKGYTPFLPNDVLVAKITPCFENGKIALAKPTRRFGFGSTEFHVLRAHARTLDPRYLVHFMRQERIRLDGQRKMTGSGGQRRVPEHFLAGLQIPLPPLSEQRRIAEILDMTDMLRAKRRSALSQLDTLTQSIFLSIFGEKLDAPPVDTRPDRAHLPGGCSWKLLSDVARLATGHTPDRERSEYWNGEVPWISLTDIRSLDGVVARGTLQNVTLLGIENSSSVLLPKGTVCFSRTASVGFVTVMGREMATSQDFMNWVCGPNLDPTYLMWALIMSRNRLLALSSGSTHRTIYMRVVEQFRVLLPPIALQHEFARRVDSVNASKETMGATLAELDALFESLQHRAFRGEL